METDRFGQENPDDNYERSSILDRLSRGNLPVNALHREGKSAIRGAIERYSSRIAKFHDI